MDFFRLIAQREINSDAYKFDDDIEDPLFRFHERLMPSEQSVYSFAELTSACPPLTNVSEELGQICIPNTMIPSTIDFNSRVYNGQFAPNGDLFLCSSQEEIRLYDTSSADDWTLSHSFSARAVNWTITDVDLSSDSNFIIYCSVAPVLNIIDLGGSEQRTVLLNSEDHSYGVFSCKFSDSGSEVLLGTRGRTIETFDINQEQISFKAINAHSNDINSACYASPGSSVIYSGSDDSLVKIWDKRISPIRAAGVLIGHREGITNVSSKNNELNLISNGKDQTLKLWDIRKKKNHEEFIRFRRSHNYQMGFNYVFGAYPLETYDKKLAEDCSLLTFKGHHVLETLIRCRFSPLATTGQRYVYSGSADGKVYVYDTYTGKTAEVLENNSESQMEVVCRDVSWHPYLSILAATSFSGSINQYIYQ